MIQAAKLAKRERDGSEYIPYRRHIDETTIGLEGRGFLSIIEIDGLLFETADTASVNSHHYAWNTLLRNIADESVMLWSVLVRRRSADYPEGTFSNDFARRLDDKYCARMNGESL